MEFYSNLIFIRHAENVENKKLNNNLLPLSEQGVKQAKFVSSILKNKFDIIISSPSRRALMTAKIIDSNKEIIIDSRLIERGWGNKEQDGKETDKQALIRLNEFLIDIMNKYPNKKILLVTHGALIKIAQDLIEEKEIVRDNVDNCTIVKYTKNKQKQIIKI